MDRFETASITVERGTSGEPDDQVHLCFERDVVAGLADRRKHLEFAGLAIDWYIHEAVERGWDHVGADAIRRKRSGQISEATAMRVCIAVNDPERVLAARSQEEIVPSDGVLDDFKHDVRPVRVKRVAGRKVDLAGVIECSSRRDDFADISATEREQVGDLPALRIDHRQALALVEGESHARSRQNFIDQRRLPVWTDDR